MTDSVLVSNFKTLASDTVETVYTSPSSGQGTIITAFTASNDTTASVSFKAYIYDQTGTAVNSVIPLSIVVRDRFNVGPSIINQVIPAGGALRVENSTAASLNYHVSGRQQ